MIASRSKYKRKIKKMRELKEGNILLTVVSCVVIHFKKEPVLPGEMLEILEMVTYRTVKIYY